MVFDGKLEQVLMLPMIQAVSRWRVWMLRKKDVEGTTNHAGSFDFLNYTMKNFGLRVFDGEFIGNASFSML